MKRAIVVLSVLAVLGVGGASAYQAATRQRDYGVALTRGDNALHDDQTFAAIEAYSGAIAQQVHRELHDHALVLGNQIGARRLLARRTLLHERGFTPPDVGPASDARVLHRDFHYTKLRHPKRPKVPMGW